MSIQFRIIYKKDINWFLFFSESITAKKFPWIFLSDLISPSEFWGVNSIYKFSFKFSFCYAIEHNNIQ